MLNYYYIKDAKTDQLLVEGYLHFSGSQAVLNLADIKSKDFSVLSKLAPLTRVSITSDGEDKPLYGFIYDNTGDKVIFGINKDVAEKREDLRVDIFERWVLDVGKDNDISKISVVILNMSQGGMAFSTNECIDLESTVVFLFDKMLNQFHISGRVIWSREINNIPSYGVQFNPLTGFERDVLYTYLTNKVRDNLIKAGKL